MPRLDAERLKNMRQRFAQLFGLRDSNELERGVRGA